MLKREYKYLVPLELIGKLRKAFLPFVEHDHYSSIHPEKEYIVRSIYFDNHSLEYYTDKVEGIKNRKKLRIRAYNNQNKNSKVFLEIKRKNENKIYKHRVAINFEHLEDFLLTGDTNNLFLNQSKKDVENAIRFYFHYKKNLLKPISLVVYNREAYFSRFDSNTRITFDKNLRYCSLPSINNLFSEDILKAAMKNFFVLEIKFYRGYSHMIHNVLRQFNLTRIAVSKYQICIDSTKKDIASSINKNFYLTASNLYENYYNEDMIKK